jgi:hypothetical protein
MVGIKITVYWNVGLSHLVHTVSSQKTEILRTFRHHYDIKIK